RAPPQERARASRGRDDGGGSWVRPGAGARASSAAREIAGQGRVMDVRDPTLAAAETVHSRVIGWSAPAICYSYRSACDKRARDVQGSALRGTAGLGAPFV